MQQANNALQTRPKQYAITKENSGASTPMIETIHKVQANEVNDTKEETKLITQVDESIVNKRKVENFTK